MYHILKQRLQLVEASTVVFDGNGKLQVFISEILPLFCNVAVDSLVSFFHECYMESDTDRKSVV